MFIGQMGCEALNFLLKRLIKEERPKRMSPSRLRKSLYAYIAVEMNGKGYGMPSSHAQYTAFFSLYLMLFLLLRHRPLPASPSHRPFTLSQRALLSLLALLCAAIVAWSRIYLNYHTLPQVLVGFGAGVVSALGWFGVTEGARKFGLLERVLDTRIASELRMRDLVVEEDLVAPGWERWQSKRQKQNDSRYRNGLYADKKLR